MFVKHFVHKLEVRCLKLRPWSGSPGRRVAGSPGRQVMHSRGFEGRKGRTEGSAHMIHMIDINFISISIIFIFKAF